MKMHSICRESEILPMLFAADGQKEQGMEDEAKEGNRYINNTRMRVCCLP